MKIKIQDNGTINFGGDVPLNPTASQADKIMRQLSELIGKGVGAAKFSGYWVLGHFDWEAADRGEASWRPIYGHRGGQRTRDFDKVLANGLNRAVVRMVEI